MKARSKRKETPEHRADDMMAEAIRIHQAKPQSPANCGRLLVDRLILRWTPRKHDVSYGSVR
jgi:hypothetical protein